MTLQEIKDDINAGYYEILDDWDIFEWYEHYRIIILNEGNTILIHLEDDKGSATGKVYKENIDGLKDLQGLYKLFDYIMYYNWIEYDEEEEIPLF